MCQGNTSHHIVADPRRVDTSEAKGYNPQPNRQILVAAYQCMVCQGMSVALADAPMQTPPNAKAWFDSVSNLSDSAITWRPSAIQTRVYVDVPRHIADAATEAFESHSAGHYRAAILLARSVIEATAKDKGITAGNLKTKIEALKAQNFIRPHIEAVAHGIRGYANDMAHGDFVAAVTVEESALVIQLMGEILDEVYQSPARLAAVQQAYNNRQQGSAQA